MGGPAVLFDVVPHIGFSRGTGSGLTMFFKCPGRLQCGVAVAVDGLNMTVFGVSPENSVAGVWGVIDLVDEINGAAFHALEFGTGIVVNIVLPRPNIGFARKRHNRDSDAAVVTVAESRYLARGLARFIKHFQYEAMEA